MPNTKHLNIQLFRETVILLILGCGFSYEHAIKVFGELGGREPTAGCVDSERSRLDCACWRLIQSSFTGSRGTYSSPANLMEQRSFEQVPSTIILNTSIISHKRDSCRKQQILLLLLCCLNGSLKESRCWTQRSRASYRRNALEGGLSVMDVGNIPRKFSF